MKYILGSLAGFLSLILLLTACGDTPRQLTSTVAPPANTAAATTAAGSTQPITLIYQIWDQNQSPAMQQIIDEFKKTQPNINVQLSFLRNKDYWAKLQLDASAGNSLPDVFWMNSPYFLKFAADGLIMPLDERIRADKLDMANYPQSLLDIYSWNEKRYALPKDFDTIGLWYNKTLFDAAGIKYPDETWDWDKVREVAKKLTDPAKGVWGIASRLDSQEAYYNTIYQNGGFVISPDRKTSGYANPATIEGLKFWTDLIKDGSSPGQDIMIKTPSLDLFKAGKIAMIYDGSWSQIDFAQDAYTKDKVDVAVLPKGKKRATVIHGIGNVIAANTKYPKEAWEFLKFLGSKRAAEIQAKTGTVMPAFKDTQTLWVNSNPRFQLKIFVDELEYAVPYPASKNTFNWTEAEANLLSKAWLGSLPVEEAAKELATQMNQFLSKEQK